MSTYTASTRSNSRSLSHSYPIDDIQKKHTKNVEENARALKRLNIAAEKAKKTHSTVSVTIVDLYSLFDGVNHSSQSLQ